MPRLFPATGRMLRLLRGAAALTIREAAAETGFTRGRIHELERGIAEPRSRESAALVSAYLLTDGSLRKHLERAHALDAQAADAIARRPRRSRSSQPEPIQMRAGTR